MFGRAETVMKSRIYVPHYKPAAERKNSLVKQFRLAGITECAFVEAYDAEELSDEMIEKFSRNDDAIRQEKIDLVKNIQIENMFYADKKPWTQGVDYSARTAEVVPLRKSEISLALKHLLAWMNIAEQDLDYGVLLEDDVIIFPGFTEDFEEQMKNVPADWDMIFFGSGCGFRVPERTAGRGVYKMTPPRVKCTDSYAISNKAAKKLRDELFPITVPIDFELQHFAVKHDFSVYWFEPPLILQGSEIGTTPSLIR